MSYLQLMQEGRSRGKSEFPGVPLPTDLSKAAEEAIQLLNLAGCRIMRKDGVDHIGVWEDLDGPELRAALRALSMHYITVVFLGPGVEMEYRVRRTPERKPGELFAQWRTRALGGSR